ncbi:hypothetical protein M413DRAFT_443713 [Hebeloma cylindrosporum]|uniref:Uncharacterized protein n=1 Tax=Hebeloma cylindrosporum TaxID=76867 RepID=A0A0C3CI59_HEBCY|nr:hypothetical protein M413DRAFT_443713 [Hebeloma cylindrosporum h7]
MFSKYVFLSDKARRLGVELECSLESSSGKARGSFWRVIAIYCDFFPSVACNLGTN